MQHGMLQLLKGEAQAPAIQTHAPVLLGGLRVLQALLAGGADVSAATETQLTPLHW